MATTRTASAVAGRAVHIKIHPRPRNLAESRQVVRVLERYGEVVMFKHLKVCWALLAKVNAQTADRSDQSTV